MNYLRIGVAIAIAFFNPLLSLVFLAIVNEISKARAARKAQHWK
jgi:hypothetical protein